MPSVTQIVAAGLVGTLLISATTGCKPSSGSKEGQPQASSESGAPPIPPEGPTLRSGEEPPAPPQADTPEKAVDITSQVAILGYHRFSKEAGIPQRFLLTTIHIKKFRAQMQTLADNAIPVISMSDFLAWRRGEKNIPPFSVIITIDDGWRSTHSLALPVLKEFGFPFTLYLYTNFLNRGGKSLSLEQIADLVAAGGEIGSHGVSHRDLRHDGQRTDEMQAAYLKDEIEGSRRSLRAKLGIDPLTFSYPYGVYDESVMEACVAAGYMAMVTVRGRKVNWQTDLRQVGRYTIHGADDRAFDWAVSSRIPSGVAAAKNILNELWTDEATGAEEPLVKVSPADGSAIKERRPLIAADLSKLQGIEPETLSMAISGVGQVEAHYDQETMVFSYQPVQRLRIPQCWVQVKFNRTGEEKADLMRWKFDIDTIGNYMEIAPKPEPLENENPVPAAKPAATPQPPSS